MATKKIPERPYLTIGEIYRNLSVALGTKNRNTEVDQMARRGDYDYRLRDRLLTELFYDPIKKQAGEDFALFVCQAIDHVVSEYINLVNTVPLDAMTREEATPALFEFFFSRQAAGIAIQFHKKFGGPNPVNYFCVDTQEKFGVACDWLEENMASFSNFLNEMSDKQKQDQYRKWKQAKELPKAGSFSIFLHGLESSSDKQAICIHLTVGRLLQHYANSYPQFSISSHVSWALWETEPFDIGRALSLAHIDAAEKFAPLKRAAIPVFEALNRESKKGPSSKDQSWEILKQFELETGKLDPVGITRHLLEWKKARWFVFSGDYKAACRQYERAFEYSLYRASNTEKILREALAVAAKQRNRTLLKRLKNQAIAFGYYETPQTKDKFSQANKKSKSHVVEDWEVEQWDNAFALLFKPECCFPECIDNEKHGVQLPFFYHVEEKHFKRKPDLTNPDRRIDVGVKIGGEKRRYPQLIWHTDLNHHHHVQSLLEAGADVNQLSDTSDSALLLATIEVVNTGDRRCFDLIKQHTHSTETMNVRTDKKKLTVLLEAVDTGQPDIVETILDMGADVDRRGHTDHSTALNQCVKYIGNVKNPEKAFANMLQMNLDDPVLIDTVRRHSHGMMGLTEEDVRKRLSQSEKDKTAVTSRIEAAKYMHEQQQKRFEYGKLLKIAKLLLQRGANPDAVHTSPLLGYTPLMLAVELDEPELVQLMLENGGNPHRTHKNRSYTLNCWDIARAYRSRRAWQILERRRR